MESHEPASVVTVSARGTLDESETHRLVDEVWDRTTGETAVIVISLVDATDVHWNALCRLARAAAGWRAARRSVVVHARVPRYRALFASVEGFGALQAAPA